MNVVASCMVPTNGYYDGTITDSDAFLATIESVVKEISRKYKINLDEVILVLPNNNHRIYSAYVSNKVLTERQIIGKQQVDAIRNQIKSAKVNDGEILVEEVPTKYTLDGERALRSAPINYQSSILAIESNVHTLPRFVVESLKNALTEANVNVLGVVVNCNCAALLVAYAITPEVSTGLITLYIGNIKSSLEPLLT
jgi:cell division ATPase FtsA